MIPLDELENLALVYPKVNITRFTQHMSTENNLVVRLPCGESKAKQSNFLTVCGKCFIAISIYKDLFLFKMGFLTILRNLKCADHKTRTLKCTKQTDFR